MTEVQDWTQVIDCLLRDSADPEIVVGPYQWMPSDDTSGRQWFLLVATHGTGPEEHLVEDEACGLRCDKVLVESDCAVWRNCFVAELTERSGAVVHDVDNELEMAKLASSCGPDPLLLKFDRGSR